MPELTAGLKKGVSASTTPISRWGSSARAARPPASDVTTRPASAWRRVMRGPIFGLLRGQAGFGEVAVHRDRKAHPLPQRVALVFGAEQPAARQLGAHH